MKSNVFIKHYRGGLLTEQREAHNVWTQYGHEYLAKMIAEYGPMVAPTPKRVDRIKYLGFGVGGAYQNPLSLLSPIIDAYPLGFAEKRWPPSYALSGMTNGNEYDQQDPIAPLIRTLERPVRRTGGLTPYPGDVADRWYIEPPNLYTTHITTQELTVHALLDAASGDYIDPVNLPELPITEAGLFTSIVSPAGSPYQPLVAYVGFDTIMLDENSRLEFTWRVQFG